MRWLAHEYGYTPAQIAGLTMPQLYYLMQDEKSLRIEDEGAFMHAQAILGEGKFDPPQNERRKMR